MMSGGAHLRGMRQSNTAWKKRRSGYDLRAVGDIVSDLIGLGFEPQTSCTDSIFLTIQLTGKCPVQLSYALPNPNFNRSAVIW